MIVCVCHNISDHKIRQAVDEGASSLLDLRKQLSVGTCCGKCHSCAKSIVRDRIEENAASLALYESLAIAA